MIPRNLHLLPSTTTIGDLVEALSGSDTAAGVANYETVADLAGDDWTEIEAADIEAAVERIVAGDPRPIVPHFVP